MGDIHLVMRALAHDVVSGAEPADEVLCKSFAREILFLVKKLAEKDKGDDEPSEGVCPECGEPGKDY